MNASETRRTLCQTIWRMWMRCEWMWVTSTHIPCHIHSHLHIHSKLRGWSGTKQHLTPQRVLCRAQTVVRIHSHWKWNCIRCFPLEQIRTFRSLQVEHFKTREVMTAFSNYPSVPDHQPASSWRSHLCFNNEDGSILKVLFCIPFLTPKQTVYWKKTQPTTAWRNRVSHQSFDKTSTDSE